MAGLLDRPVPRDPSYEYGTLLPFRKPKSGGPAEWSPEYSDVLKSLIDAYTAPRRAWEGNTTPQDAMNFAMAVAGAGSGVSAPKATRPPAGSVGMNVWHGSPYKFDRLNKNSLLTGEGANAYGQGFYFAENPKVAQTYRNNMLAMRRAGLLPTKEASAFDLLQQGKTEIEVLDSLAWQFGSKQKNDAAYKTAVSTLENVKRRMGEGYLYKFDVPDDIVHRMLSLDAPVASQPKDVQHALAKALNAAGSSWREMRRHVARNNKSRTEFTGADVRGALRHSGADESLVADAMRQSGVPGFKYLDQGSRGTGTGSQNFVLFDDSAATMLDRL